VTFGCNSSNAIPKRRDLAKGGALKVLRLNLALDGLK
jgi:hypothetical protein